MKISSEEKNYGKKKYAKIIDEQFNNGYLRRYTKDINDYYELKKEVEKLVESVREDGGVKPACLVAGAIRLATEQRNNGVKQEELSKQLGVTEVSIRSNKKRLEKKLLNNKFFISHS